MYECDYRRGLDWWLDLLYTLIQRVTTLYRSLLHTHTLISTVTSSRLLFGSGFQRRTFPFLWVPDLSPCLSYQLLTATPQNDWTPTALRLTSNQLNHFTSLYSTALQYLNWTRSVAWYNLGADYTENTASNSTSTVAWWPLPNNGHCLVSRSSPINGFICLNII
jgi:hypothetical protein